MIQHRSNYVLLARKSIGKISYKLKQLEKEPGVIPIVIENLPSDCRDYVWASKRIHEVADQLIEFIVATLANEGICSESVRLKLNLLEESSWKLYLYANRLNKPAKKDQDENELLYFSRQTALLPQGV